MRKIIFLVATISVVLMSCKGKNSTEPVVTFPKYHVSEEDFKKNLPEFDSISASYLYKTERILFTSTGNNFLVLKAYPKAPNAIAAENLDANAKLVLKYAKEKIENLDKYDKVEIILEKDGQTSAVEKDKSEYSTEK